MFKHTAVQAEESERYTSPANCWLMTPVHDWQSASCDRNCCRSYCQCCCCCCNLTGMLHSVLHSVLLLLLLLFTEDHTMICRYECTPMYVEGNSLLDSGHLVSYAHNCCYMCSKHRSRQEFTSGIENPYYKSASILVDQCSKESQDHDALNPGSTKESCHALHGSACQRMP